MGMIFKRLRLVGSKGERESEVLFDTGSTYSLVRKDIAEQLATLEPLPEPMNFETAQQGHTMTATHRITLNFYINGYRFSDEFIVMEDLSEEAVIGVKTMQGWRLRLDLENERILIDPNATRLRII